MSFKIYTKTGDKGQTSLIGGTRVPKYHLRIETYGTVDELNSYIGLVNDVCEWPEVKSILKNIQDQLFTLGSHLAADPETNQMKLPEINAGIITEMEQAIDAMDLLLPPLKNFILPGGHVYVSYCHIARCVCRRTERLCVQLNEENILDDQVIVILNRLSDYLFTLARYISFKLQVEEVIWSPTRG